MQRPNNTTGNLPPKRPMAPPAYRPQATLQAKTSVPHRIPKGPPPVYRIEPARIAQAKPGAGVVQAGLIRWLRSMFSRPTTVHPIVPGAGGAGAPPGALGPLFLPPLAPVAPPVAGPDFSRAYLNSADFRTVLRSFVQNDIPVSERLLDARRGFVWRRHTNARDEATMSEQAIRDRFRNLASRGTAAGRWVGNSICGEMADQFGVRYTLRIRNSGAEHNIVIVPGSKRWIDPTMRQFVKGDEIDNTPQLFEGTVEGFNSLRISDETKANYLAYFPRVLLS
jgi:hypothetical protein